jgi:hypothetical protein
VVLSMGNGHKMEANNASGERSSVTAMVVSGIKENNNTTVGTKT